MNDQQLRERVNSTLLIPSDIKQKLLSIKWNAEIFFSVESFFDKYGKAEEDVNEYLAVNAHKIIIDYIHELERSERTDIMQRLEELRKLIAHYRRDI